jgi:hypothetical protein
VVAKVRKRLSVNKRAAQEFYMERQKLKKLGELEVTEQYKLKISKFCSFGDLR